MKRNDDGAVCGLMLILASPARADLGHAQGHLLAHRAMGGLDLTSGQSYPGQRGFGAGRLEFVAGEF